MNSSELGEPVRLFSKLSIFLRSMSKTSRCTTPEAKGRAEANTAQDETQTNSVYGLRDR